MSLFCCCFMQVGSKRHHVNSDCHRSEQGCQTYGPRARTGPPKGPIRPTGWLLQSVKIGEKFMNSNCSIKCTATPIVDPTFWHAWCVHSTCQCSRNLIYQTHYGKKYKNLRGRTKNREDKWIIVCLLSHPRDQRDISGCSSPVLWMDCSLTVNVFRM